jgi:putative ABC transport system substrate-binding protein
MVTGITSLGVELSAKYLELLLAAAPKLKRVGILVNPNSVQYATHIKNARRAPVYKRAETRFAEMAKAEEIEPAIAHLTKEGVDGMVVLPNPGLFTEASRIVKLALARRWPMIAPGGGWVRLGGFAKLQRGYPRAPPPRRLLRGPDS